jgi:DNA-binding SARP family transcriptional activator
VEAERVHTLRVLGGFAIEGPSGSPHARLAQRRAEAVLAVLAVAGDLGCTRDRLTGLLWPESDESRARHSLRDALHVIRQALGPGAIVAVGDRLSLDPAAITTDVSALLPAFAPAPDPAALDWYRGPLLDGFHVDGAAPFVEWLESERARYAHLVAEALERLAGAAERDGHFRAAAAWWARLVLHDPYNTRVVIRCMRAQAAAGDRANAVMDAEAHARRLRDELDLEPDPELAAEIEAVRNGNGGATGAGGGASGASAEVVRPVPDAEGSVARAVKAVPEALTLPGSIPALMALEPTRGRSKRRASALAAAAVVLLVGGTWGARALLPSGARAFDPDRIAVPNLDLHGAHAGIAAIADQLHGVLTRELEQPHAPVAVETQLVGASWRRVVAQAGDDPRVADLDLARRTGAGLVLRGELDSVAGGAVLTLTLVELPGARVMARRTARLPAGVEEQAARRLLYEVLALEAGQPEHRLPELLQHDPATVRLFLAGARRPDLMGTCQGWLTQVWRSDSTLLYPGLDCLHLAGLWPWRGQDRWFDSVAVHVWRGRASLVHEDRAYVDALVGPWFGLADDGESRIRLWETAADAAPAWWLPRAHLAYALMDFGPMTTITDWRNRAGSAIREALAASGWQRFPVLEEALWFGLGVGDTALAGRAADAAMQRRRRTGSGNAFRTGGWWFTRSEAMRPLIAAASGDRFDADAWHDSPHARANPAVALRLLFALGATVPAAMPHADAAALRWEEGDAGTPRPVAWWVGKHWRVRGDFDRWLRYRRDDFRFAWQELTQLADLVAADAAYLRAVLYLGAPADTITTRILARMDRIVSGDSVPVPRPETVGMAHCWLVQWRLARGDTAGSARAVAVLRALAARDRAGLQDGLPSGARWEVCPLLIEALVARVTGRDALARARALDRYLRPLPMARRSYSDNADGTATHDQTRMFLDNLLASRLLAAAGDTAGALAAVRRRPWDPSMSDFFEMPTEYLRLEGLLAAASADSLRAVAAYDRYLALRSTRPAHAPWAAEWDSVRAELAGLQRSP